MSVTIRKKEEPRNTPLLTFVLVACVPILLSFLGGISAGKSSGMNKKEMEAKLADYEKRAQEAETYLQLYSGLSIQIDSLFSIYKDEASKLEEKLDEAIVADDDGASLDDWKRKKRTFNGDWEDTVEALRKKTLKEASQNHQETLTKEINVFIRFLELKDRSFDNKVREIGKLQLNEAQLALQEQEEELQKQEKENETKEEMRQQKRKIEQLEDDLRSCQKGGTDNSVPKAKIEAAVKEIQDQVIPVIPTGLLSNKGTAARETLRGKLADIMQATTAIK